MRVGVLNEMARRWLRVPRLMTAIMAVLWIYLAVRLWPHAAAAIGIENGAGLRPSFDYPSLGGGRLTAADMRGKVVLVNFWATWCLPCRAEMPLLQAMYDRHRERGLIVIGLSVDRGPVEDVTRFLAERRISYPVAIIGPDAERTFGGVGGYPTSLLIDRTGRIRQRAVGPLAMLSFEPAVRRLLAEGAVAP